VSVQAPHDAELGNLNGPIDVVAQNVRIEPLLFIPDQQDDFLREDELLERHALRRLLHRDDYVTGVSRRRRGSVRKGGGGRGARRGARGGERGRSE